MAKRVLLRSWVTGPGAQFKFHGRPQDIVGLMKNRNLAVNIAELKV